MLFSTPLTITLGPPARHFPYRELLGAWLHAGFEPHACRAAAQRILERHGAPAAQHFNAEAICAGGSLIDDALLLPDAAPWQLDFVKADPAQPRRWVSSHGFDLSTPDEIELAADLLRRGARERDARAFIERFSDLGPELLSCILGRQQAMDRPWRRRSAPGIYRREHASLLVCSETTQLLIDPLSAFSGMSHLWSMPMPADDAEVDAILITHTHNDHWSLASILARAPGPHTQVLVPQVPRRSLLCHNDMKTELQACGQACLAPAWGSTVTIGDIEIDVLPFYGEQPTRDGPAPLAGLRNWGNCYRLNTPQLSVIVLVDSGEDPDGSMLEVLEQSYRRRGRADVVMSCLRSFESPFFGGLSSYWAALPFERLRELYRAHGAGQLPATTAGPVGAAALCRTVDAKYYLPYAHGYGGVGVAIDDIGWGQGEPSELSASACLAEALAQAGTATKVLRWSPGSSCVATGRGLQVSEVS